MSLAHTIRRTAIAVVFSLAAASSALSQAVKITDKLSKLGDVTITSPADNQVLKFSGGRWVNGAVPAPDLSGYVPTTRTVNGQPLSSNVTISAEVPLTFSTGLTRSTNTVTVNSSHGAELDAGAEQLRPLVDVHGRGQRCQLSRGSAAARGHWHQPGATPGRRR